MTDDTFDILLDKFHKRCEELTGDAWCPYPSEMMIRVTLAVKDDVAKELIVQRRLYLFPDFLRREPMESILLPLWQELTK